MIRNALLAFAAIAPAPALGSPFTTPVPDSRLDELRGGFVLPGGLDVNIGVVSETRIDNQLVLRSTLSLNDDGRTLVVEGRDAGGTMTHLDLQEGGSFAGADGVIRIGRNAEAGRVILNGRQVDITHMTDHGIGSIVANSGNDRAIDVLTTVDIDIGNASPEVLGSALLRVQDIALNATAGLAR